jgi:hypothetical protein
VAEPLQDHLAERDSEQDSVEDSPLEQVLRSGSLLDDFKLRDSPLTER